MSGCVIAKMFWCFVVLMFWCFNVLVFSFADIPLYTKRPTSGTFSIKSGSIIFQGKNEKKQKHET